MIIARTPFRISFFGGGTDFPAFFCKHGGAVLSSTINKYCYLLVHRLTPFFHHRFKASYSQTESVNEPNEFEHPLIRETLLCLEQKCGIEIAHVADLPGQIGLGSSSAFTVGLLNALHAFHKNRISPEDLAQQAIHIERERVGDDGGWQDQYAAAYGGFRRIRFDTNGTVEVQSVGITANRLRELESHLLLFDTKMQGSAKQILHNQLQRVSQNKHALLTMLNMVDDAAGILIKGNSLADFGGLLHESWLLKRSLSSGISNSKIDEIYQIAREAGALGGKLLGAGGRGLLLIFAAPVKHATIKAKLNSLASVDFSFCPEGSRVIFKTTE